MGDIRLHQGGISWRLTGRFRFSGDLSNDVLDESSADFKLELDNSEAAETFLFTTAFEFFGNS